MWTKAFLWNISSTLHNLVLERLHDNIKPVFDAGTFSINASFTAVLAQTMFKPSGALSITRGRLKGRPLESGQDHLGRWVYCKFRRNTGPPVTVIVTYQVVDRSPPSSGPTTYATQLYVEHIKEGRHNPENLWYHHANNLVHYIKTCQTRGEWLVVAGDFNKVLGQTTRGLTRSHSECGLIDAVLDKHGDTDFTTYQRGKTVINYILVDDNIFRCITLCTTQVFCLFFLEYRSESHMVLAPRAS